MEWAGVISSEPIEEEEMTRHVIGFITLMHKQATGSEVESTPISYRKRSKRSSPDKEAQKDWAIILMDYLDLAFNDQPVLEGTPS